MQEIISPDLSFAVSWQKSAYDLAPKKARG